jgi:hypothetical protein
MALETLLSDVDLRKKLGENGKQMIELRYSVNSQLFTYLSLFS